jgi:hypothetical protein
MFHHLILRYPYWKKFLAGTSLWGGTLIKPEKMHFVAA